MVVFFERTAQFDAFVASAKPGLKMSFCDDALVKKKEAGETPSVFENVMEQYVKDIDNEIIPRATKWMCSE